MRTIVMSFCVWAHNTLCAHLIQMLDQSIHSFAVVVVVVSISILFFVVRKMRRIDMQVRNRQNVSTKLPEKKKINIIHRQKKNK